MAEHQTRLLPGQGRVTGPGAASLKYDILTALLATSAQSDAVTARIALRLSLVITARFNWQAGSFSVGLRELARMWGVTERTAKREMAEMRNRRWVRVSVPAARGRVARYALELPHVLRATMPYWASVGPDFEARMTGAAEPQKPADNIVPLHPVDSGTALADEAGTGWRAVADRLLAQDPAVFRAWFAGLRPGALEAGTLVLHAPTRFAANYVRTHYLMRIRAAMVAVQPGVTEIVLIGPS